MMSQKFRYTFILLMMAFSVVGRAQVSVEAKIDSMAIFIGQQAHLTLEVVTQNGAKVMLPNYKRSQWLVPGVEVLSASKADTSFLDNNQQRISRVYTLTSFDEKLYPIPGMKIKVNGKLYQANQLALKVITMDVDTLHPEKYFPPKDVQDNPFSWAEWREVMLFFLLFIMVAGLSFYLFRRLRQNKPIIITFKVVKKVPAHQKALDAIQQLKAEQLHHQADQKAYYTRLTDTLRQYISERYGFNAMEMTSQEIIERLNQADDKAMMAELQELFVTADLVKFAKYATLMYENDRSLMSVVSFIEETKRNEQAVEEKIAPELTESEEKQKQSRKMLQLGIGLSLATAVALLTYVIYSAYQLLM